MADFPKLPATETCNGRNARRGKYCRNPAGAGTDHLGQGRCKFHNGRPGALRHGEKSTTYGDHAILGDRIRRARSAEDLLKVEDEVAILKAIVEDYVHERRDRRFEAEELDRVLHLVGTLVDAKKKAHEVGRAWSDARADTFMRWMAETFGAILRNHLGDDPRIPSILRDVHDEGDRFRV